MSMVIIEEVDLVPKKSRDREIYKEQGFYWLKWKIIELFCTVNYPDNCPELTMLT